MDAREDSDPQVEGQVASILATIKRIYAALADLPGVKDNFNTLLKTNKQIFAPLVSPLVA